jgi:hypothetical protein
MQWCVSWTGMEQLLILSILNNGCQVQSIRWNAPIYCSIRPKQTDHVPEAQHYLSSACVPLREKWHCSSRRCKLYPRISTSNTKWTHYYDMYTQDNITALLYCHIPFNIYNHSIANLAASFTSHKSSTSRCLGVDQPCTVETLVGARKRLKLVYLVGRHTHSSVTPTQVDQSLPVKNCYPVLLLK